MAYWTRRRASQEITEQVFEIAERTLFDWREVAIVYLNGRAHAKAEDWMNAARKRRREQLARQGVEDVPKLQAAQRATAVRMARRSRATPIT